MEEYEEKFQQKFSTALDGSIEAAQNKIEDITNTSLTFINDKMNGFKTFLAVTDVDVQKLKTKMEQNSMTISNMDDAILPSAKSLKKITSKMKSLLQTYEKKLPFSTVQLMYFMKRWNRRKLTSNVPFAKQPTNF